MIFFFGFGDVIIFFGGYVINEIVIGYMFGFGDLILYDLFVYNSII